MGWIALIILFFMGILYVFLSKVRDGYIIEEIKDGFIDHVYIYQIVDNIVFGWRKRYIEDDICGFGGEYSERKNFYSVEEAKKHIDKLLTPIEIKEISYP